MSAVHISRNQNAIADFMSRSLNANTEWQLTPTAFFKKKFCTINVPISMIFELSGQ